MRWELLPLLLGALCAAVPLVAALWYQQRSHNLRATELLLAKERLEHVQQQLRMTGRVLEETQAELADMAERNSHQAAQISRLERELEIQQQLHADLNVRLSHSQQNLKVCEQQATELATQKASLASALAEQAQNHEARIRDLHEAKEALRVQFAELAGKIFEERSEKFSQNSQALLGQLLDPLKERIQAFEQRVEQSYTHEARERFSLAKELERLQHLNQRLGDEAQNLAQALRGQKTQGNWGELVLERVLESAGLVKGREYQTQVNLRSAEGERFQPDVVLYLPNERQVIIDSKVSLTAYQQAVSAADDMTRQNALKAHVQSLRAHIKGLSLKDYQKLEGLHSLDMVLLFVPIEGAFAAALQTEPALFQEAFDQHIVLVSPTTLLSTLRVVESLWRQERQGQNAREIAERAGALYDKFVAFVADLDEIGVRLGQLDKAYSGARNKLLEGRGNIVGRIENLKLLGARASKKIPEDLLERAGEILELDHEHRD